MKSIKQYIQNVILLLILIIAGITGGPSAYPVLLSGGILLIMATWQSTYEKESRLMYIFQFPVSVMFSYFGCPWISPLCFYEFRCFGICKIFTYDGNSVVPYLVITDSDSDYKFKERYSYYHGEK